MTDLEDESRAAKEARRRRWLRRNVEEFAIAAIFLGAVFAASHFSAGGAGSALAVASVLGAIAALTFWFTLYVRLHMSFDEFERVTDLKAHAVAGASVVLLATSWGVAEAILEAPDFPMVFLAPVYSCIYVLARFRIVLDIR